MDENVTITFTEIEMSGKTLVGFLKVLRETEPENYQYLRKQLIDKLETKNCKTKKQ